MKKFLPILFLFAALRTEGQEPPGKHNFISTNPFNAGINQVAINYEYRQQLHGFTISAGYIYQRTEDALKGFGYVPSNYIIANTYWAYKGFIVTTGYNRYLKKNPDAWFGIRALYKYMYHDSLDLTWQWNDSQSFTRRVQSDRLNVTGVEFLYGFKKEITKLFYYEIFGGAGFRFKFHNMTIYNSYLDKDPSKHQDPSYPFSEKYRLFRPTIHLGINLGIKL